MYHGDTSERQCSELHMVKKEKGKEKQQLTRPEPATSTSIANPLAAKPGRCQHPLIHTCALEIRRSRLCSQYSTMRLQNRSTMGILTLTAVYGTCKHR